MPAADVHGAGVHGVCGTQTPAGAAPDPVLVPWMPEQGPDSPQGQSVGLEERDVPRLSSDIW